VKVKVLAIDLEQTLIDDALNIRPRPGLLDFLIFCHKRFDRVAIFTTVEESEAREVVEDLAHRGHIPSELADRFEYIDWAGEHKDLTFISNTTPEEVLLVDDDAGWVRPDQRSQWIAIKAWNGGADSELARVKVILENGLAESPMETI
jgi:hypothetical protein